ncbi:Zinc finger protein [Daphnia magna]|uniref:Zinc finger protein n=1 Tax=Daphnia magna TaxID=35525 RepID=A0A164IAR4_9CRUS|nr:Zinc finger protein [Daphnia magna]
MGRTAVKDKLMSTLFLASRDKVITILKGGKVALTTDLWTSPNKLAFIGITVSLLNDKFEPTEAIIGFKQMLGEHSGINIGNTFFYTIKLFELQERMLSITTDNANSNETFIDYIVHLTKNNSQPLDKDMWIRCFAHVLNICLRDLVSSIRASPQRIKKFKNILKLYGLNNEEYEEEEIVFAEGSVISNDLLPILDCKTRWSSAFYFVKRAVKLRRAIDEIAKDADLRRNEMENEEWYILSEVLEFLEEFATIPKYIEGSGYPTLSLVVPMYNRLLTILEDVSQSRHRSIKHPLIVMAATAGLKKLSSYYDKASPIVMAATFLDPRLKIQYFIDNGWDCGGESRDAFQPLDENLITGRVMPA